MADEPHTSAPQEPGPGEKMIVLAINSDSPVPPEEFHADALRVVEIPGGICVAAIQVPVCAGGAASVVEIRIGRASAGSFLRSLEGIRAPSQTASAGIPSSSMEVKQEVWRAGELVGVVVATTAFVAVNDMGCVLDFYHADARRFSAAMTGQHDTVETVPVLRISTLPGRLAAIFEFIDRREEAVK